MAKTTQGGQPAGPGGAGVADDRTDAPVRTRTAAAGDGDGPQRQVQPRFAVHGGRAAAKGRLRRGAGNGARLATPRTDGVRPHRRRPDRALRLDARTGCRAAARVPAVRRRALAAERAATRRGRRTADPTARLAGDECRGHPRHDPHRHRRRCRLDIPHRGGIPVGGVGRRIGIRHAGSCSHFNSRSTSGNGTRALGGSHDARQNGTGHRRRSCRAGDGVGPAQGRHRRRRCTRRIRQRRTPSGACSRSRRTGSTRWRSSAPTRRFAMSGNRCRA